jgi:hypothetical protein
LKLQSESLTLLPLPKPLRLSTGFAGEIVSVKDKVRGYPEVEEHADTIEDEIDMPGEKSVTLAGHLGSDHILRRRPV